jgi:hypothetical protein
MFRFALTAYLSVAAIVAPLLCCCALEHAVASTPKTSCCGKSASTGGAARSVGGHAHHHHGHRHHGHAQGKPHAPKSVPAGVPAKHNPDSCPCDKHLSKLVAVLEHKAEVVSTAHTGIWGQLFHALPVDAISDASDITSAVQHHFLSGPPASLAGRDLLRAYHILRC